MGNGTESNIMSEQTHYIYALTDPRTNEVRYVGKTKNPDARFLSHFYRSTQKGERSRKDQWIGELKGLGLKPTMIIIDKAEGRKAAVSEWYWIVKFGLEGARLLNEQAPRTLVK